MNILSTTGDSIHTPNIEPLINWPENDHINSFHTYFRTMPYKRRLLIFSSLILLLLGAAFLLRSFREHQSLQHEELAQRAGTATDSLIAKADRQLDALIPLLEGIRFNERNFNMQVNRFNEEKVSAYCVFEGKQLIYWTDPDVLPDTAMLHSDVDAKIMRFGNGWYYVSLRSTYGRTLMGLMLIKREYALQNKFLINAFHPRLGLPENADINLNRANGSYPVKIQNGRTLFSVVFPEEDNNPVYPMFDKVLIAFISLFIYLLAFDVLRWSGKHKKRYGFLIATAIVAGRWLLDELRWPSALFDLDIFDSTYYASGYLLNSLGDLLLTAATASLLVVFLYSRLLRGQAPVNEKYRGLLIILVFGLTFLYSVLINYILSGLIINSQISFDINNIFQLSGYTAIGMLIIGLMLGTFYLICDGSILLIRRTGLPLSRVAIFFLITQGAFLCMLLLMRSTQLFADYGVSAFLLANILIIFIAYIRNSELKLFSFSRTVLVILVFSVYASQIIYTFNETREQNKRQLLAAKLENEQDIVAEFLLQQITPKLRSDESLLRLLTLSQSVFLSAPGLIDEVSRHLDNTYFNGYLDRYEVSFKFFDNRMLPINKMGDPSWNLEEIRNRNFREGRPTNALAYFFFQGNNARTEYVGEIQPGGNDAPAGTLIVTLTARATQDDSGFPELLLSDKVSSGTELSKYAWAKYQQGKLVNQSGNFNYYLTDGPYMQYFRQLDGMRFVSFDDYLHLFYRYNKNLIIISSPRQGLWVWVTLFSYLFTFFSIAWILFTLCVRFVREGLYLQFNFNSRIQITIVMIVVGTLLLIGLATVTYIVDNYEQAQNNRIREKLNNIRMLAEAELGNRADLGESLSDDLQFVFSRLARTLRTDFNIYNDQGRLCFTSQPGIYDQEILAPLMNRTALISLTTNQKALAVQRENIGNLLYTAAYEPLRNSNNKNIGFLSLPYFDKDNELKRDISGFLVALINLYVLLFSLSTLVAFFISNRITQPLRIIQDSLRRTKLGSVNEPIIWKTKDEIGALINEYNRMVNELQRSAELLAKSERESAWREMAKQVAHEIKNPLTPMKLGIQHLQRAIHDNHPNKEELVRKISATMIEQIDTLSNIATEFSHFAKMPKPEYTGVELISVLRHTVDLYEEDDESDILFEDQVNQILVRADKDQLIRIFSNLIKNALQAIPEGRKGIVNVFILPPEDQTADTVTVAIKDNGKGIPKELISKIFVPNFTTKSSGTGLGLAMVKAMTEGMGGSVWFETEEDKGTVFYVRLVRESQAG